MGNSDILILSKGKIHKIEFDYEGLSSLVRLQGIIGPFGSANFTDPNDYTIWISKLKDFLATIPISNREKVIRKGIEYGKLYMNFHREHECQKNGNCVADDCWERRITMAEALLEESSSGHSAKIQGKLTKTSSSSPAKNSRYFEELLHPQMINRFQQVENLIIAREGKFSTSIRCAAFCELLYEKKYILHTDACRKTMEDFAMSKYGTDISVALGSTKKQDRKKHQSNKVKGLPALKNYFL